MTTTFDPRTLRTAAAYEQARETLADLDEGRAYECLDADPRRLAAYAYPWPDETVTLGRHDGTWVARVEMADTSTGHLDGWVILARGDTARVVDADDVRRRADVRLGYVEVARRMARTESFRGLPWPATVAMVRAVWER